MRFAVQNMRQLNFANLIIKGRILKTTYLTIVYFEELIKQEKQSKNKVLTNLYSPIKLQSHTIFKYN